MKSSTNYSNGCRLEYTIFTDAMEFNIFFVQVEALEREKRRRDDQEKVKLQKEAMR